MACESRTALVTILVLMGMFRSGCHSPSVKKFTLFYFGFGASAQKDALQSAVTAP